MAFAAACDGTAPPPLYEDGAKGVDDESKEWDWRELGEGAVSPIYAASAPEHKAPASDSGVRAVHDAQGDDEGDALRMAAAAGDLGRGACRTPRTVGRAGLASGLDMASPGMTSLQMSQSMHAQPTPIARSPSRLRHAWQPRQPQGEQQQQQQQQQQQSPPRQQHRPPLQPAAASARKADMSVGDLGVDDTDPLVEVLQRELRALKAELTHTVGAGGNARLATAIPDLDDYIARFDASVVSESSAMEFDEGVFMRQGRL